MPRSDWLRNAAAIGCLIAGVLAFDSALGQQPEVTPPASKSGDQGQTETPSSAPPINLHLTVNPIAEKPACDAECQRAEQSKTERETKDLVAQESMADAAWQVVRINWAQFVAGVATLILLGLTFNETRKTAKAAQRSADLFGASERAHIFFHPVRDNFKNAVFSDAALSYLRGQKGISRPPKPSIKIKLSNLGKTAAALVEIQIGLRHVEKTPPSDGYSEHSPASLRETSIAGSSTFEMDIDHKQAIAPGELELLESKARSYFIQGRVLYRAVVDLPDDPPHETTFCWKYNFRKRYWREHGGTKHNRRT